MFRSFDRWTESIYSRTCCFLASYNACNLLTRVPNTSSKANFESLDGLDAYDLECQMQRASLSEYLMKGRCGKLKAKEKIDKGKPVTDGRAV